MKSRPGMIECESCLAEVDRFTDFVSLGFQATCNQTCVSNEHVLGLTLAMLIQVSMGHGLKREALNRIVDNAWAAAKKEREEHLKELREKLS